MISLISILAAMGLVSTATRSSRRRSRRSRRISSACATRSTGPTPTRGIPGSLDSLVSDGYMRQDPGRSVHQVGRQLDDRSGRARSEQPERRARRLRREERRARHRARRVDLRGLGLEAYGRPWLRADGLGLMADGSAQYLKAASSRSCSATPNSSTRAFRDILGRDADQGGLEFYRGVLRQGVRRTAVLLDIMRSEEFRRTLAPAAQSVAAEPRRAASRAIPPHDRSRQRPVDPRLRRRVAAPTSTGSRTRSSRTATTRSRASGSSTSISTSASSPRCCRPSPRPPRWSWAAPPARCCDASTSLGDRRRKASRSARWRSRARSRRASARASTRGICSRWICRRHYDLLFGLDVFEHLNPNKLDAYLARLAPVTTRRRVPVLQHPGVRRGPGLRDGVSVLR